MASFHLPVYPFVIRETASLSDGLKAISLNNGFPLIVIDSKTCLIGVVSSGDITKYLQKNNKVNLIKCKLLDVANKYPITAHIQDSIETVKCYLSTPKVRTLPILDSNKKVKKVIMASDPSLQIGKYSVGKGQYPFLIAEIGVNHNGSKNEAKLLIEEASNAGCQAIKFQYRSKTLYNTKAIDTYDLGTQYIISEIERTRLSINELEECFNYALDKGVEIIITPFDLQALEELEKLMNKISALKIASCDLTNFDLIDACIKCNKPIIVSTGMSYEHEIIDTSQFLLKRMCEHAFLHCYSTYPSPTEDINLAYLDRLAELTGTVIGYSSHDGHELIPCLAIARGAEIIEFHITKNHCQKGTDHKASLPTNKLKEFTNHCHLAFISRGSEKPRKPSQGELANKISLGKSYALKQSKKYGHIIIEEDLIQVSPGIGYQPKDKAKIIGKRLIKDKEQRSILLESDFQIYASIDKEKIKSNVLSLEEKGYKVGIPIRYHDAKVLSEIILFPMYEFHMSDRDLDLEPSKFIDSRFKKSELIIHAIEQFEDGFIFDIATDDKEILERSLKEIDRLSIHIEKMRSYFMDTYKIPVVINIGGHSNYGFLSKKQQLIKLEQAITNLNFIRNKHPSLDFLPQTMPPYPWHQGGRSYHNLLTDYDSLERFINKIDSSICLDISHTYLSASKSNNEINEYIKLLNKRIKSIHLSDASGINGEGLQIGEGCLDFLSIHKELKKVANTVFLVPEIWQGHLNRGQKFFIALEKFNQILDS